MQNSKILTSSLSVHHCILHANINLCISCKCNMFLCFLWICFGRHVKHVKSSLRSLKKTHVIINWVYFGPYCTVHVSLWPVCVCVWAPHFNIMGWTVTMPKTLLLAGTLKISRIWWKEGETRQMRRKMQYQCNETKLDEAKSNRVTALQLAVAVFQTLVSCLHTFVPDTKAFLKHI